jgi:hypothetical protein
MSTPPFALVARLPRSTAAELALAAAGELGTVDMGATEDALDAIAVQLVGTAHQPPRHQLRAVAAAMDAFAPATDPVGLEPLLLDKVLANLTGDPLLLAIVAVEAGRRAGLELALADDGCHAFVARLDGEDPVALTLGPFCPAAHARRRQRPALRCPHQTALAILDSLTERAALAGDLAAAIHAAELRLALPLSEEALERLGRDALSLRVRLN